MTRRPILGLAMAFLRVSGREGTRAAARKTIRKFRDRLLRPVLHGQALMREDLAGLLSRLDALALVADAHRRRLDDMGNVADAHRPRIDGLEHRLDNLGRRLECVERSTRDVQKRNADSI